MSTALAPPFIDWAALEDDFAQRCPDCLEKLHDLIETNHGVVRVCTNHVWHGYTVVFIDGNPKHLEGAYWLIEALVDERGIERKQA